MATISGKDGTIKIGATTVLEITNWSFNPTSNNPAYASNATGGYKTRRGGVKDASGSATFKLDLANPITDDLDVGTAVTLLLHLDATRYYTVPAIVDRCTVEVDVNDGEVIGGSLDFSTTGAWTNPTY